MASTGHLDSEGYVLMNSFIAASFPSSKRASPINITLSKPSFSLPL